MAAPPVVRGTAAWKYFGDFRGLFLAGQVLTLQVAHPVVAAGVRDHSGYRDNPWPRLMRTSASLSIYVYGGPVAARYEADRLRKLHRRFHGVDDQGRPYHALDPGAYAWVHATLVKLPVDAQWFFGRGMPKAELDEYYTQLRQVGLLLGLRDRDLPPDWESFTRYYDSMVAGFGPNETISELLDTIHTVRKPLRRLPDSWWSPVRRWLGTFQQFLITGTLPAVFRDRLGLPWTAAQQHRFDRFCRVLRVLGALVPATARAAHIRLVSKLNVRYRERRGLHARA
jgi:uncharacterized protein (DUF2236 family)